MIDVEKTKSCDLQFPRATCKPLSARQRKGFLPLKSARLAIGGEGSLVQSYIVEVLGLDWWFGVDDASPGSSLP